MEIRNDASSDAQSAKRKRSASEAKAKRQRAASLRDAVTPLGIDALLDPRAATRMRRYSIFPILRTTSVIFVASLPT
jgi:hypothetical protein